MSKYPGAKKENYINESANDNGEGKPNSQKNINSDKKQNKNNNFKKFEGEQNSKDNIKNKEADNSFNNFEHDILSLEFDEDLNECFDIKNDCFCLSKNNFSGRWPKKRLKDDESSEVIIESNYYDNFKLLNLKHEESIIYNEKLNKSSQTSSKTFPIANNSFSKDSINMSNTLIFPINFLFSPSSDFSSSLENFNQLYLSFKIERSDNINDDNRSFDHLFFKKRKRENKKIFNISKINKSNKKLNNNKKLNFENKNNSCTTANKDKINSEFKILQNENNNKSMINYINKNNKKKSTKKIKKKFFSTKKIDNSNEKNKIIPNNLSNIKNNNDSFIKKIRKKYTEKLGERLYEPDRTNIRKFRDFSYENKTSFEDIFNQNPNFWDDFFKREKSDSFHFKIEGKEYKSCSIKFLKHIFSKDGVDVLYEKFLSDIQYQNKIKEILKEKYDSYRNYQKNIHKIYCEKYKDEELKLDD